MSRGGQRLPTSSAQMGLLSVIWGFKNIICGHFISGHSKTGVSFPDKICLLKYQSQFGNLPESFSDAAEEAGRIELFILTRAAA